MLYRQSILLLLVFLTGTSVQARGVYQHPDAFLKTVFGDKIPKPDFVWFTGDVAKVAKQILGHKPASLRTRYWLKDGKSAWILEEIGKEKNITAGFVIKQNQIEKVKVLIFRESRGWEIRRNEFTSQFTNSKLQNNLELDRSIDGISGATLSVKAMTRLSRLSLFLHQHIMQQHVQK